MGCSQGKKGKDYLLHNSNIINNFKILTNYEYKNVSCLLISFPHDLIKQIDCEVSLLNLKFLEEYTNEEIFQCVIDSFDILDIFLPQTIYIYVEGDRRNLYLKLYSSYDIYMITNKFIGLMKHFRRMLKFTQDFSYKIMKKIDNETKINSLDSMPNNKKLLYEKRNRDKVAEIFKDCENNDHVENDSILNDNSLKYPIKNENWSIKKRVNKNKSTINLKPSELSNNNFSDSKIKISAEDLSDEQIISIQNKYKIVPVIYQNLISFFYEKYDYIDDNEYISLFLIGMMNITDLDITNYMNKKEFLLKEIIKNPYEENGIRRLIFSKNNKLELFLHYNVNNCFEINSYKLLYLQINKRIYPEQLYSQYQIMITILNIQNSNKSEISDYLKENYGDILEIFILEDNLWIVTFLSIFSVNLCLETSEKVYNNITFYFTRYHDALPITGSFFSYEKINLPDRKDIHVYKSINTYIPSYKYLFKCKDMWILFKLENENFNRISVREFLDNTANEFIIHKKSEVFEIDEKKEQFINNSDKLQKKKKIECDNLEELLDIKKTGDDYYNEYKNTKPYTKEKNFLKIKRKSHSLSNTKNKKIESLDSDVLVDLQNEKGDSLYIDL